MNKCDVQGLVLGGCSDRADGRRADGLCYYHGKLEDGLTRPPGAEADGLTFPGTAVRAHASYARSTHPQFAKLVNTGGYEFGKPVAAEVAA